MPFQNEQFGQSDEEKDQPERLNHTVLTSFQLPFLASKRD